jgi:cell division septation protein DedD
VRRPHTGARAPFIRRLEDGSWTVQVASTVDDDEAELEREWFESAGEPAFIRDAEVRGQTWRRVLIGRYPTRAEAERTRVRLEDQATAVSARR